MIRPNYSSNDATALLNYAEHIFQKMTENYDMFPHPVPSMATLESALIDYRDAYIEAMYRDRRAIVLKGQKGKELHEVLYRLSHYVDAIAKGDPAIILAAGYRPSKSKQSRVGATPKASDIRVQNYEVGSGMLKVRVKPWQPARLYLFEHRKKGAKEWESKLNSKSSLEYDWLEKFQEYEFRVSYLGTDVTPNFSDIITGLVV